MCPYSCHKAFEISWDLVVNNYFDKFNAHLAILVNVIQSNLTLRTFLVTAILILKVKLFLS